MIRTQMMISNLHYGNICLKFMLKLSEKSYSHIEDTLPGLELESCFLYTFISC